MLGNIRVDGNALEPQPSRFRPIPPEGTNPRGINGMFNPSSPVYGWAFEVGYGSNTVTDDESYTSAVDAFMPVGTEVDLTWEDGAGTDHTKRVTLLQEISPPIHWGSLYEVFSFMLYEIGEPVGS